MHEKDTDKLFSEIKSADKDIERFREQNKNELVKPLHVYLNELLAQKNLNKAQVIRDSLMNVNYAYHIFLGKKKNPSRTKILSVAIAMKLNLNETQYLLRYAGLGTLYPRNSWDAVIISAIEQKLSVEDTNLLLAQLGEEIFLG